KHLTEPLPDPLEKNPGLSNGACFIISKMTAKEREERYQTPEELLQDIRELRRLSYIPGKEWRGGQRKVVEKRSPRRFALETALAAMIPAIFLFTLTVLEPTVWLVAWARLPGRPID